MRLDFFTRAPAVDDEPPPPPEVVITRFRSEEGDPVEIEIVELAPAAHPLDEL